MSHYQEPHRDPTRGDRYCAPQDATATAVPAPPLGLVPPSLLGRRVLLAEDCPATGPMLREILVEQGCRVVGPITTVREATGLAMQLRLDAALLDLGLRDGASIPLALLLAERGVPFAFFTGSHGVELPAALSGCQIITKPAQLQTVLTALSGLCGAAPLPPLGHACTDDL